MNRVLFSLALIMLMASCAKRSDLTVYNDTGLSTNIVLGSTIYNLLPEDEPAVEKCYLNSYILFGETKVVPLIIEKKTYLAPKELDIVMKPGKDRSYHIELDRAGFQISNPSIYTIVAVEFKKDEEDWEHVFGDPYEVFSEQLSPTESLPVEYTSIRITYNIGYDLFETLENEIELTIGETYPYVFTGD